MTEEFSEEKDEPLGDSIPSDAIDHELQNGEESLDDSETETEQDPLTQCVEELAAEKDQRLRVAAEFANYRRRMESQRADWSLRAKASVIRTLLPILDDLERSLSVAAEVESKDNDFLSLKSGVNLVFDNFISELEKLGLNRIETAGKAFDEHFHEAVGQAPAPEGEEDGMVLYESQAGYCLGDLVLRHAKVIVGIKQEISVEAGDQ